MKVFDCKTMRVAVIFSALAFTTGVLMQIPAILSLFDAKFIEVILAFIGLVSMFAGLALVFIIAFTSLFPKASKRLKLCEH